MTARRAWGSAALVAALALYPFVDRALGLSTVHAVSDGMIYVLLALGCQLLPTATCDGGGGLRRPAPAARVRLGGVTRWRLPCPTCQAGCTGLPPFLWR